MYYGNLYLGSMQYTSYLFLILPTMLFALWAQMRVNGTFRKYSEVRNRQGITGAQAAQAVLEKGGVSDVRIEHVRGQLTDHYDPQEKVIRLSDSVYGSTSVAAVGVAAHEAGHAVQYAVGYGPVKRRNAMIPVTQFGSTLSMPLILIGLILNMFSLLLVGIVLFTIVVIYQAVTLPVEFNASSRALAALGNAGILTDQELTQADEVLKAAALTYIAALAVAFAQLLRFVLIFMSGRRRD